MSKYNKSQLYFLMLNDKFYKRDEVRWLKKQENGHQIINIYLQMIFECINKDGILCRQIGDEIEAYSNEDIAMLIEEPEEIVTDAIEKLIMLKFITKLKDNTYFIEDALDLTNQSVSARKKQLQRRGNLCPPDIEIDKEIEEDIELITNNNKQELEINLDNNSKFDLNCVFKNYIEDQFERTLSISEIEELEEIINIYSQKELKLCIDEAVRRDRLSIGYIKGILENRNEWGTVEN